MEITGRTVGVFIMGFVSAIGLEFFTNGVTKILTFLIF